MKKKIKLCTGNFSVEYIEQIAYLTCPDKDLSIKEETWSDNKAAIFFTEFIKINIPIDGDFLQLSENQIYEIKEYTNKFGILADMAHFRERFNQKGYVLTKDIEAALPFMNKVAIPLYQFVYLHSLLLNAFKLKQALSEFNELELVSQFLYLLFQPYGKSPLANDPYLGIETNGKLSDFPLYFWNFNKDKRNLPLSLFLDAWRMSKKEYNDLINQNNTIGGKYSISIAGESQNHQKYALIFHPGFVANLSSPEYNNLYRVLCNIDNNYNTGFFLTRGNVDEITKKMPSSRLDSTILKQLSRIMIAETISAYLGKKSLTVDENNQFICCYPTEPFISTIFEEFANICEEYELRKCQFQKCGRPFIYKKGKKSLCCCHACIDKYRKNLNRNSKKM